MRIKKINTILLGIFMSGLSVLAFTACEDYDFPVDKSYEKTFRPSSFTAEAVRATSVRLEWDLIMDATQYVLEVSQDSLEFANPVSYELPVSQDSLTLTDLYSDARYSARIKALGREGMPDSEYNVITFATLGEQIFTEVVPGFDDASNSNFLILSWVEGSNATHIRVNPLEGEPLIFDLDAADLEAASLRIENLAASTEFVIEIFRDNNRRGSYTYRSFEAYPEGVRLVAAGEDLKAILESSDVETLSLLLEAGALFEIGEPMLHSGIKRLELLANPTKVKPVVQTTRLRNNQAESWLFRNIEFTGNSGKFLMDERNTSPLSEIVIEGCYIHTYRGVLRLDGSDNSLQIANIVFDDVVFEAIGDYGIVNGGRNGGYRIENVVLKNSTINGLQNRVFDIRRDGGLYLIESCTFYNAVGNNREVFHTENGTANLEIRSSIFGRMFDVGEGVVARSTNLTMSGDFVFESYVLVDFPISENHPFMGITQYGKTSAEVFADPETGDFSIIDNTFPGRVIAGDPRWR
jgi:hypothetical protein